MLGQEENILGASGRAAWEEKGLRKKRAGREGRQTGKVAWKWQRNFEEAEWRTACCRNISGCGVVGVPGHSQVPPLVRG